MGFKFSPFNINPLDIELGNGFVYDPFENEGGDKKSGKKEIMNDGNTNDKKEELNIKDIALFFFILIVGFSTIVYFIILRTTGF